jgi:importin-5
MVHATFKQLISCIGDEHDSSFLASLFKALADSLVVIGGPTTLPTEYKDSIMEATKRQLSNMAERRRARTMKRSEDVEDNEDRALIEEMEDFALDDMAKLLKLFDPQHNLLVAVSSVKELGSGVKWDEDRE